MQKNVQIPQNWSPENHQLPIIGSAARFKVIVWHRKAHKTTLAINELLRMASMIPGTYWYVAPQLNQARKIVWEDPEMLQKYCPQEIWDKRNNSGLFIPFPNGSKLYILGADNPDSLRGPNPKFVVFDEYDDMDPIVWSTIVQPIMMANPLGRCWFVGTYKGRKDLFNKYMYALEQERIMGQNASWQTSILKASTSGIIDAASLEEARQTTTDVFFKQEYECEPLENAAAVFRNIEQCTVVVDDRSGKLVPWLGLEPPNPNKKYNIGVDLGKYNDFTVITPFDLTTFRAGKQDRFNLIDWNLQEAKIELFYLRYSKGKTKARVRNDATGVGDMLSENLSKKISTLEPFVFTEQSRRDLLTNLAIKIETGKIKIPNDEVLLNELKSFQYVLKSNKGGRQRIAMEVPSGVHDDCVMSLALAVWDIPDEPLRANIDEERELLKQFDAHRDKVLRRR